MLRNAKLVVLFAPALTLSACAAEPGANKEGANAEDSAPQVARLGSADGHSPYQGELSWDERVSGELGRRLPYHYWSFEGTAGSRVFLDAASRAGDDLFVLFYVRSSDGGWELRDWNDDCYRGTLNACLELSLPEAEEYLALVTTYEHMAWNARPDAEYHLTVFCRDGVGACEPRIGHAGDVGDTCGGILGELCREGLVCDYSDSECGADIQGTCVEDSEILCTAEYDPVCGCDGVTYSNDCRRRAAHVGLAHDGEC